MNRFVVFALFSASLYGSSAPIFVIDQNAFTYSRLTPEQGLWLDLFSNIASQDSLHFHTEGLSMGIAGCCSEHWMLGLAAFYSRDHYHHHRRHDRGRIVSIAITPIARIDFCPLFAEAELLYAYNRVRKKVENFRTNLLMPHLKLGLHFSHLEPYVMLDWAVNFGSSMLRSEAGLRVYHCWEFFTLDARGGYVNKAPFHLKHFHCQNLGTWGVSALLKNQCGFFGMLGYDGEAGSGYLSNQLQLKLGMEF